MASTVKQTSIRDPSTESQSSSGSGSSSTSEEERLRKLFESCDADGDGLIDRNDFSQMCKELGLEEWTSDILLQLGVNSDSRLSFDDFIRFRAQVIETELQQTLIEDADTGIDLTMNRAGNQVTSWPTMSSDSLGAISGRPDSLDYDSGARDLQSPEPVVSLQKLLESHNPNLFFQVKESCTESQEFLDLANRIFSSGDVKRRLYVSEARDLQSPEPVVSLQKLLESHNPNLFFQVKESCTESQEFLDLANRIFSSGDVKRRLYVSEARDLQSPEPVVSLQKLLESHNPNLFFQVKESCTESQEILDLANRIFSRGDVQRLLYDHKAYDLQSPEPVVSLQKLLESHNPNLFFQVKESCTESQEFLDLANRIFSSGDVKIRLYVSETRDLQSPEPVVSLQKLLQSHNPNLFYQVKESCTESQEFLDLANRIFSSGDVKSRLYVSEAHDLQSPEPVVNLQKLLESHNPNLFYQVKESCTEAQEFLDLANRSPDEGDYLRLRMGELDFIQECDPCDPHCRLHQATITSLKGEIIELRSRLQRENLEQNSLEKQINKLQIERRNLQDDFEERLDEITFRYEERITELHSVIAELRKKIERHQINVIREEDEEDDAAISTKSQDGDNTVGSLPQTHDTGGDLNSELSRVVTELESAIHERRSKTDDVGGVNDSIIEGNEDDGVEEKALEVCKKMEDFSFDPAPPSPPPRGLRPATFHPPPPPPPNEYPDPGYLQEEINSLRTENTTLQEQIIKQEVELQRFRLALANLTDEKNKYKKQIVDHQTRNDVSSSPVNSRTSTPTKSQHNHVDRSTVNITPTKASDQFPVAKVAELKKLKTMSSERPVLGSEISGVGIPNTKVAEHLVQSLWKGSNIQEIVQNVADPTSIADVNSKVPEFEIELERLQSQIDNYKSQLDVANLTLEESKSQCNRLTVLIGKYESNNTALQIVLNYSQLCIETYEIISALLESELGVVLANCRAAGLGNLAGESFSEDQGEIASILQRAHQSRRAAENVCKHTIHKLDKLFGLAPGRHSPVRPWEELSGTSKASSASSTGSAETEFTKVDERRLRDYIQKLKNEQSSVHLTVMELESVYSDPGSEKVFKSPEAQRLDLENAVIMQELMAMKEEKAELKAQNYLLEKEKRALELRMSSMESQEQAYLVQIEHLKSEVTDQGQGQGSQDGSGSDKEGSDRSTPPVLLSPELRSRDIGEVIQELTDAVRREKKLKSQVSELVAALEKLSRNSEIRHQQSAEFVNDLKRANSALISAFDKAKKKYQSKLKKLEGQMQSLTERYESQIRMLKQKLSRQEDDRPRVANETSL